MRAATAAIGLCSLAFAIACSHHTSVGDSSRAAAARTDASDGADAASAITAPTDAGDSGDPSATGDGGDRPPLAGFSAQYALVADKEKLGVVEVPLGAREPRPIMIAFHGGSERPEKACAGWRAITDAYPFVVCPHGWGGNEARLGWRDVKDTTERIARAIAKTKETFGSWVKDTPTIVLAGFSMGGAQVALVAQHDPATYKRIVVGDSAHDPRSALTFARAWVKGGGERAIFLCTTSGCEPSMRAAAKKVASENGLARLNISPTRVHGLAQGVQSMRRDWPWLVQGAPGWETYYGPTDTSLPGKTEIFGAQ